MSNLILCLFTGQLMKVCSNFLLEPTKKWMIYWSLNQKSLFIVENLDKHKSCENDNVHSFVLKSCAQSWDAPLAIIFRKSIDSGEVPDAFRWGSLQTWLICTKNKEIVLMLFIIDTYLSLKIIEKIVKIWFWIFWTKSHFFQKINTDLEKNILHYVSS